VTNFNNDKTPSDPQNSFVISKEINIRETEWANKNGQSRDTQNSGHTRHRTKTNKKQQWAHKTQDKDKQKTTVGTQDTGQRQTKNNSGHTRHRTKTNKKQ
jgi:hypothetical protein